MINNELYASYENFAPGIYSQNIHDNWSLFSSNLHSVINKFMYQFTFRVNSQNPRFNKTLKRLENKETYLPLSPNSGNERCMAKNIGRPQNHI